MAVRILHISDSHSESQTLANLDQLARTSADCDVVAHTGDCVSGFQNTLPRTWDKWPQQLKLSVPGNHGDHSQAFVNLSKWLHEPPWSRSLQDVLFVGLDLLTSGGANGLKQVPFDRATKAWCC